MTPIALTHAREAAAELLNCMVITGALDQQGAQTMITAGFTTATGILADLRSNHGLSAQAITDAFQARLDSARAAGDVRNANAAEFTLAVWDGMQRDLAEAPA